MRCQWTVRRTMRPAPEGRRRWDPAYQEVLAPGGRSWPTGLPVRRAAPAHGRPAMRSRNVHIA